MEHRVQELKQEDQKKIAEYERKKAMWPGLRDENLEKLKAEKEKRG